MATFIDVETKEGISILVNIDMIEKIVPSTGSGSVLHFRSSFIGVKETVKDISDKIKKPKKPLET